MKNVRIKVTENCNGNLWWVSIYVGKNEVMSSAGTDATLGIWERKHAAIRNAKAMAKRLIIKFDSEIIKQKGC